MIINQHMLHEDTLGIDMHVHDNRKMDVAIHIKKEKKISLQLSLQIIQEEKKKHSNVFDRDSQLFQRKNKISSQ